MDQFKKIAKYILNVVCVVLFIILVLVIYAKAKITFSNDKVHANYFGYRIFEVASGSMEPTLKIKDVVLVKVNTKNIKNNDIIVYLGDNDSVITHRVLRMENDTLIVKGDANNTTDAPIKKDQVVGKVVDIYPKLGIWKRIFTEPKTLILIFVTFILFDAALAYDGKKDKEEKVKEKKEKVKKEEIVEEKEEIIEPEGDKELLEFTRKINLDEIDSVLKKKKNKKEEEAIELLEETNEYTVRLDLDEIGKNIRKINK